jgi:hypothetical protein
MLKAIWTLSNSKLGLLLIGFALTTVVGAIFTDWIQRRSWQYQTELEHMRQDFEWKRSKKFELLQQRLDEGQESIEEISDLINLRFFRLQKVYESALARNFEAARKNGEEYMETVESWNVKLIINQNKLGRLVTDDAARKFNNYETDNSELSNPSSLHGHFFLAHKSVQEIFQCAQNNLCSATAEMKRATDERLRSLDYFSDAFVDNVSSLFLERTFALDEFRNL